MDESLKKELDHIRQISFNDIFNSDDFKERLFQLIVKFSTTQAQFFDFDAFPTDEKLQCPDLDAFLRRRNAVISERNKQHIYLWTKMTRNNIESTAQFLGRETDTTFNEGWNVSDGWVQLAHDMLEYENMEKQNIPGFPKTFKTYQKHKEANSEKYQAWIAYAKEVDHGKD